MMGLFCRVVTVYRVYALRIYKDTNHNYYLSALYGVLKRIYVITLRLRLGSHWRALYVFCSQYELSLVRATRIIIYWKYMFMDSLAVIIIDQPTTLVAVLEAYTV